MAGYAPLQPRHGYEHEVPPRPWRLQLKGVEEAKIECARKFFASLNDKADNNGVKYDVVKDYDSLLSLVSA